jgi:hypothetical protein
MYTAGMSTKPTIKELREAMRRDFAKLNLENNPRPDVENAEHINWVFPHGRLSHASDADMAKTGMSFSLPARVAKALAKQDRRK